MILKRKSQLVRTKSKEKFKLTNPNDPPKPKKPSANNKMTTSASVRTFKVAHHLKQLRDDQVTDENTNNLNYAKTDEFIDKPFFDCTKINAEEEEENAYSKRMRKSASTGGIKVCKSTRRSLSPALSREKPDTIRVKYSSKQTSRSKKQKIKQKPIKETDRQKSSDKLKYTILAKYGDADRKGKVSKNANKSTKTTRQHSQHLKTQQSSKMPSVSKEMDSKKPKDKTKSKMKDPLKPSQSKSRIKNSKIRDKIKNSIVFSDVSFQEASPLYSAIVTKENFYLKLEENQNTMVPLTRKIQASIMIQKHFRGYLTRKYIEELKYMVFCIIKIQKTWRGYSCRKKMKKQVNLNKKNLSIQNSLITIKDFNEQKKQERQKDKHFHFLFEDLSSNKKDLKTDRSDKDASGKKKEKNQKLMNLLQSLLEEEELEEKIKQRIRQSLGKNLEPIEEEKEQQKQDYVKNKIHSQIISEKSFNSPRDLRSPKNSVTMNSPSSWAKNKSFQCTVQPCTSPPHEKITKRMISPNNMKSPASMKKSQSKMEAEKVSNEIKPIDTTFQFLEQFEMKIIDYLKEEPMELQKFLARCQNSQYFRTRMVLSEWDKFVEDHKFVNQLTPQFSLSENAVLPVFFPADMKREVLRQPDMQIYLEQKNYSEDLWKTCEKHRDVYDSMVASIFDGLTEAIYEEYRGESLFKTNRSRSCFLQGYPLFTNILMNSLTRVQSWSEYHCGMELPVEESDPNFQTYKQKKQEREDLAVKSQLTQFLPEHYSSWVLWIEVMAGEMIFQELVEETSKQMVFSKHF